LTFTPVSTELSRPIDHTIMHLSALSSVLTHLLYYLIIESMQRELIASGLPMVPMTPAIVSLTLVDGSFRSWWLRALITSMDICRVLEEFGVWLVVMVDIKLYCIISLPKAAGL
jgi:hypothetical protein